MRLMNINFTHTNTHTMKDMTFTQETTVTFDEFENLLVSALEGGSNYWYFLPYVEDVRKWAEKNYAGHPLSTTIAKYVWEADGEVRVANEEEEGEEWILNRDAIGKGFRLMNEQYSHHWNDLKQGQDDADTADVWFQLALMGEVIFG